MDRLVQRNVLAMSGRAVEASGDVDVLLLDKTGTITLGNRQAAEFVPVDGVADVELAEVAQLASLADETPEGRSIVVLAKERYGLRERELSAHEATFIPFSATTRMSGVDSTGAGCARAPPTPSSASSRSRAAAFPARLDEEVDKIARAGGTPLVVAQDNWVLGVIHLKDIVKGGMSERFDELRKMGIRTVMITGDNRVTAAVIARGGGCRRLPRRGDAGGEDGADQGGAGEGPDGGDDRRRNERRARPRAGRRRRCHEHGHLRRQGGRQHGRPRLEPDEADRDRRGRRSSC